MKTSEVFGIQQEVKSHSYVDRQSLDSKLGRLLERNQKHVCIRGASKSGKSWLRQRLIENPILIQCRLNKKTSDIYIDALSALDIKLELQSTTDNSMRGSIEAKGDVGIKLLAKLGIAAKIEQERSNFITEKPIGRDVNDLNFIADIIKASGRRLVIEDFHYLSNKERKKFAFDLKALWDYGVFVVIVGVWSFDNLLLSLNPDLSARIEELTVEWSKTELQQIIDTGGTALNIKFSQAFKEHASDIAFGSAGLLQELVLKTLDELQIFDSSDFELCVSDIKKLENAAMEVAENLNALYQEFARKLAAGIRARKDSTGIYAYTIAAILEASNEELTKGYTVQEIFTWAHARQPRVQMGNLKQILPKFEELQVDSDGRGLVIAYDESGGKVTVVDRQILLYRKYKTVNWPWDQIMAEADSKETSFEADAN